MCIYVCTCVPRHFSRFWLFATLWTVASQAPLSLGFSNKEHWSGLPCPPPGNLPNSRIQPVSLMFPALAGRFFTTSTTREAHVCISLSLSLSLSLYIYIYIYIKCVCVCVCVCVIAAKSLQLCPPLCDPIDISPPGSPIHFWPWTKGWESKMNEIFTI